MVKFVAIIQAILVTGKQLQELNVEEEGHKTTSRKNTLHSVLLRKLVLTASSSSVIGIAAKLLSALNKDAAEKQDIQNLFISTDGQFSEVEQLSYLRNNIILCRLLFSYFLVFILT